MGGELLLDTGALVALLDRSETTHSACKAFYESYRGTVVTSEAVLTEATHLLADVRGGSVACLDFVLRSKAFVAPSTEISLQRCRALMAKYADVPMDFADATLVVLAEELNADLVFTLDSDFSIYRIRGRRTFRVQPSP